MPYRVPKSGWIPVSGPSAAIIRSEPGSTGSPVTGRLVEKDGGKIEQAAAAVASPVIIGGAEDESSAPWVSEAGPPFYFGGILR